MAANDQSGRRILPQDLPLSQNPQMATFAFQPQQFPQRETQKNYVFVDEHNRHKRLKVMRACEGCRRRKIKCDAATTNTWPCSACIRLKLHCVRPNGFDCSNDFTTYDSLLSKGHFAPMTMPYQGHIPLKHDADMYITPSGYPDTPAAAAAAFQTLPYDHSQSQHTSLHYTTMPPQMPLMGQHFPHQHAFPPSSAPMQHQARDQATSPAVSDDSSYQQDLSDVLGSLKLDAVGIAPYMRNKTGSTREDPAVEEEDDFEFSLPPLSTGTGGKIRIPPALMPDDSEALAYFDLYFTHVHPYVPVLNKSLFYQQWTTDRESISPLILEALFATGGRLADDPGQGHQWLALASRHADAFMDTPRLSTLQALLIILKAREGAPKRGYFYRSWMSIQQCVQMAKDLCLDEHHGEHQAGGSCDLDPIECQTQTRVWQTIFAVEVMIGAPQGRHDFSVNVETVDFQVPRLVPGEDASDYQTSRLFNFFIRIVRNVGRMSQVYRKLKKRQGWEVDPNFSAIERAVDNNLAELPPDLCVTFPADGSPPWLPSSHLGNVHSYHYLTVILAKRPLLSYFDPIQNEAEWKRQMMICYDAAKNLCRLQEAVVRSFGLVGLQNMQRGASFSLYSGLSCIVLHLVAVTSPDPHFNSDGREYFTRHMRVIEQIMNAWPMPELQRQIDAVREAFSADVRKPFVLKPSFLCGSPQPSSPNHPGYRPANDRAASLERQQRQQQQQQQQRLDASASQTVSLTSYPLTPAMSIHDPDIKSDPRSSQSLVMMPTGGQGQDHGMTSSVGLAEQPVWNPSRIFEHWQSQFGTPEQSEPESLSTPSSINLPPSTATTNAASSLDDIRAVATTLPSTSHHTLPAHQFSVPSMPSFVTPAMWRESVASVYEGGLKRSWEYEGLRMAKR